MHRAVQHCVIDVYNYSFLKCEVKRKVLSRDALWLILSFLPEREAQGMQLVREKGDVQGRTVVGKLSGAGGMGGRFEKECLDNVDRIGRTHFRWQ